MAKGCQLPAVKKSINTCFLYVFLAMKLVLYNPLNLATHYGIENEMGDHLRTCMQNHDLAAINTFYPPAGPTYWRTTATRIQLIQCERFRDHVPLANEFAPQLACVIEADQDLP